MKINCVENWFCFKTEMFKLIVLQPTYNFYSIRFRYFKTAIIFSTHCKLSDMRIFTDTCNHRSEALQACWPRSTIFQFALCIAFIGFGCVASAQTTGDSLKFSQTQGNPACQFFDGFADNADGTVTDPRNGLIWKRCAEGSVWQGAGCSVAGLQMNWFDAMAYAQKSRYQGHSDWRLPSQTELQFVMGQHAVCKENDPRKKQYAASTAIAHATSPSSVSEFFWTTSVHVDNHAYAWDINLSDGSNSSGFRDYFSHVRLVRKGVLPPGSNTREFDREFAKLDNYRRSVEQQNENNLRERLAIEAERNADLNKERAKRQLLKQGAQLMYLQAAKAQRRSESVTVGDALFPPEDLYELILENFPLSEVAIKASDQLDRIRIDSLNLGKSSPR